MKRRILRSSLDSGIFTGIFLCHDVAVTVLAVGATWWLYFQPSLTDAVACCLAAICVMQSRTFFENDFNRMDTSDCPNNK